MRIDPQAESPAQIYATMIRAITPRPIAWVSTISPAGITNLAPFSFFNAVSCHPAALMFSPVNKRDGSKKDTVRNIEQNGQFVVNVVPFAVADKMAATADELEYEVSEFEAAGLTPAPSQRVAPPQVAESPIRFECELLQIVHLGEGPLAANVVFGKILLIEVLDAVLGDDGKIDPAAVDSIGRMGGKSYCRTLDRFEL